MAQVYEVQYQINVNSATALESIAAFQEATVKLDQMTNRFTEIARRIGKVNAAFIHLNKNSACTLNINTNEAERKLNGILDKLSAIRQNAATVLNGNIKISSQPASSTKKNTLTSSAAAAAVTTSKARSASTTKVDQAIADLTKAAQTQFNNKAASSTTGNKTVSSSPPKPTSFYGRLGHLFSYHPDAHKYLGNVYADTGANMMVEMVKGMGIAYGMSAIFSGVGRVFADAADYDNISKTTRNILATHDTQVNFQQRFDQMNALLRQVGVETKFTAPQVADAGRFLAMAGLSIEEISQAIRPISDIALIGDTDLGETADVVTNIMTAYQIPAEKMNRVADIMTATFTSANVTLMDLAESFKYSASLFKKAGVPFEVATASLGILGNAGIKGSQAGTTMRTILANIYKPTEKQAEAWDAIGVKRTDKKGNIRSVVDIFSDLHQKGIDVKTAYGLFHKTAAQGAVALADAVDTWNQIIVNNFLSDSLAKKLAQEKKNTIQGIWYQITSAFTESGMQGFESLQGVITEFLQKILNFAKSSEFAQSLRSGMSLVIQMGDMLFDHIAKIIKIVQLVAKIPFASDIAKMLIYTQMWLHTITSGVKMIISGKRALQSLYMWNLVLESKKWVFQLGKALFYLRSIHALKFTSFFSAMRHSQAYVRLQNIRNVAPNFARKAAGGVVQGTAVQSAAVIGGWGKLLAPFAPVAIAGAAIAGIYAIQKSWDNTRNAAMQYLDSVKLIDGISMSNHATQTDKYLRIVYDKQNSVNKKLQEYLQLRREELGLASSGIDETNTQTFLEQFPELWEKFHFSNFRKLALGFGGDDAGITAERLANQAADMLPLNSPYRPVVESEVTGNYVRTRYMGRTYSNTLNDMNRMNAATLLFTKGADTSEGSEVQAIVSEFNDRFLKVTNPQEWGQVYGALLQRIESIKARTDLSLGYITMNELGGLTESQWKNAPAYIQGLIGQVFAQLDFNQPDTANAIMLSKARKLIAKYAAGVIPTAIEIQELLQSMGIEAYNPMNGIVYDSKNNTWWNLWGYDAKDGFLGTDNMDPQTAAQNVMGIYTHTQNLVNKFAPPIQHMFDALMKLPQWSRTGAGLSVSSNKRFNAVTGQMEDIPDTDSLFSNGVPNALHNGADQSEYKSHYKNTSAAPKQVIVKIENLMRVDKQTIDMTDSRQVAAINNIKQELATALLDVVQDFNANMV